MVQQDNCIVVRKSQQFKLSWYSRKMAVRKCNKFKIGLVEQQNGS